MDQQNKPRVKTIPLGYHTMNSCLIVRNANHLADFLKKAFNATELNRMSWSDGTIAHAEFRIGDSTLMMGEAMESMRDITSAVYLYVENVDQVYHRALKCGASTVMEPADMFWGDRLGGVKDSFGNLWWIATHIEDVGPDEMKLRGEKWMSDHPNKRR